MKVVISSLAIILIAVFGCVKHSGHFLVDEIGIGDTLTLKTRYSDCGEWGGHIEQIQIFDSLGLFLKYQKDTVDCETLPNLSHEIIESRTKRITQGDKELIQNYIDEIKRLTKEEKFPCSNASDNFTVTFKKETFGFVDWCKEVDNFGPLTKEILKR
jgi:hypothetical protein